MKLSEDSKFIYENQENRSECSCSNEEDCCCFCCYCCCSNNPFYTCYIKKFLANLAEFKLYLQMTIFTSQFIFGSTSFELKDKIWYTQRCIKIGRRYIKLSIWSLYPLFNYNVATIHSKILLNTFIVFMM